MDTLLGRIRKEELDAEKLPALSVAPELAGALEQNANVVISAPPGAGKSTILPICIFDALKCGRGEKILMLEPRRMAARQIAERISYLLGEKVGQTAGYRVRFENRTSENTGIEILTEGILTRRIVKDPTLEGIKAVIFDEFHERGLNCDHALALVRETRRILRPDIRIIIMSATIDSAKICEALNAVNIESQGRCYPIKHFYANAASTPASCPEDVARAIGRALSEQDGDILAFLPGEGDIRRCAGILEGRVGSAAILPLYGMMSPDRQRKALLPCPGGERKIVLATPVAETSVTVEGVKTVIDSGLCKKAVFDHRNSLSGLETVRISRDMADQRAGRAGRTSPGCCYRLYTEGDYKKMTPCRAPEILEADLCSLVLDTAVWGGSRVTELPWLTPPPQTGIFKAEALLKELDAIGKDGRATPHGIEIESLPCHPRIAQMLLAARGSRQKALSADLAALMEEKDPLARDGIGTDISLRINALRNYRKRGPLSSGWAGIERAAAQYRRIAGAEEDNSYTEATEAGALLAEAYPERIAKAGEEACGHFLTAGGERVRMDFSDPLASREWIVAALVNINPGTEGGIFMAAQMERKFLDRFAREVRIIKWEPRNGEVLSRTELRIGKLVLESRPVDNISAEEIIETICSAAIRDGASMFNFDEGVRNLQRRLAAAASWHPELELPDLSDDSFLAECRNWLPQYIGKAKTAAELKKIDLRTVMWNMLEYEQQKSVENIAPSHIQVPTGSRIALEYRQGAEVPVLRVRLQECFGMMETPRVDNGNKAVLMELLSPGFKPVQLTQDLKSFWSGTYFEVKKELKRRYPRHSWPDDPLSAQAVRGVKKNH